MIAKEYSSCDKNSAIISIFSESCSFSFVVINVSVNITWNNIGSTTKHKPAAKSAALLICVTRNTIFHMVCLVVIMFLTNNI